MKTLPRKTWMVTGALGALTLAGAVVAGGAAADTPTPSPTSLIDTVPVPTDKPGLGEHPQHAEQPGIPGLRTERVTPRS